MAACGKLSATVLARFEEYLVRDEKSEATIEKYLRDARAFQAYLAHRTISKSLVIEYKRHLIERGYAMRSINSMLAAVNSLLRFIGREECRVKSLKIQHKPYCAEDRELTRAEYRRLLEPAGSKPRLQLVLQAICATGIRVSELRHLRSKVYDAARSRSDAKARCARSSCRASCASSCCGMRERAISSTG